MHCVLVLHYFPTQTAKLGPRSTFLTTSRVPSPGIGTYQLHDRSIFYAQALTVLYQNKHILSANPV